MKKVKGLSHLYRLAADHSSFHQLDRLWTWTLPANMESGSRIWPPTCTEDSHVVIVSLHLSSFAPAHNCERICSLRPPGSKAVKGLIFKCNKDKMTEEDSEPLQHKTWPVGKDISFSVSSTRRAWITTQDSCSQATDTRQTNSHWKQCCYKYGWLTQTLGHLSGPSSISLTGQHSWGGQLVTMKTAVADTRSPAVVRSLHLSVIYLWRGTALEHWNKSKRISERLLVSQNGKTRFSSLIASWQTELTNSY